MVVASFDPKSCCHLSSYVHVHPSMVESFFRDGSIDKLNVHDDVLVVGVPNRIITVQKTVFFMGRN